MTVLLHSGSFAVTPALQKFTEQQLKTVLERFGDRVERVAVRMDDVNGPRGGLDKRCGVTISLARHRQVYVEETGGDLYMALGRAIQRAKRAMVRHFDRWQKAGRQRNVKGVQQESGAVTD